MYITTLIAKERLSFTPVVLPERRGRPKNPDAPLTRDIFPEHLEPTGITGYTREAIGGIHFYYKDGKPISRVLIPLKELIKMEP